MWGTLANFWPTPLAGELTSPPGALVAHAGVAGIAMQLFPRLAPLLR